MSNDDHVLVLGIGNILMGDEGIGVHVVERVSRMPLPEGVRCLDGGTGSFLLLEPMQKASRVILIDATADGKAPGTVTCLAPRFASDYPKTLTAHDIGLKDLLDVAYLTCGPLEVTLFAVSIELPRGVGMDLSPEIAECVPQVTQMVTEELLRSKVLT